MSGRRESGQAAVEFVLFLVALVLCTFLILQLAWIGVQKWQFNHFAAYAARAWSVDKKSQSPQKVLADVQWDAVGRWNMFKADWVKLMWVSSEAGQDDLSGITYSGVAPLMPIFRPWVGETMTDASVPPEAEQIGMVSLPSTGLVRFDVFIPMEHEPQEDPAFGDNDCSDPCNDNGR